MPSIVSIHLQSDSATHEGTMVGVRNYQRRWRVVTDSPASSAWVELNAGSAAGLDVVGSTHPDNTVAIARLVNVEKVDDTLKVFDYTVDYSTSAIINLSGNPLLEPPVVEWSAVEAEEAYFVDQDGKQVVNSIGQQFEQLPTRMAGDWEVVVIVNVSLFDLTLANDLWRSVNAGNLTLRDARSVWTLPPDNAYLAEITPGQLQRQGLTEYYQLRMRWKINPEGWNASEKYLDYGTYEKDGDDWKPVFDTGGGEIVERFPLGGNGLRVLIGTDAAELAFKPYKERNHMQLPV